MGFHWVDWTIIAAFLAVITGMAIYTKRYTRSVAGFLAANRSAGRYLLCICDGIAGLGAITIIMMFEMYYEGGFTVIWWDMFRMVIVPAILSLSGWIIYRFRQTRALTLAQFFEMRYSKNFRVFCGILIWISGIVNFGIFPAVGARFFMNFMGIPETTGVYVGFMLVLISFALLFTLMGGQIAVMITDFIQGVFCNLIFVTIIIALIFMFKWDDIVYALSNSASEASMVHPFKIANAKNFNIWFYMILAFGASYGFLSWQGNQGYNAAARNAHEARMGKSLAVWRLLIQNLFVLVLPVCAFTFMHHPSFASQAEGAKEMLASISDDTIRNQVSATVALRFFLPTGLIGGLAAVMLAAFISTHDTYLHSWGSVFIQDVILPFRKKPLSKKQHMLMLKISMVFVAIFIFLFSLVFRQSEAIVMFFQITGAIFCGGAGSVIIGGLYWKRGTTSGAWAGMLTGSTLAVTGIVLKQIHQYAPFDNEILLKIVSLNGAYMSFGAAICAIIMYVTVSILTCKKLFNLDKLLHRGKYQIIDDKTQVTGENVKGFKKLIGINSDFNTKDKIIYMAMFFWTVGLVVLFVTFTAINLIPKFQFTEGFWLSFWKGYIYVSLVLGVIVAIWYSIGGFIDMKKMFARLKSQVGDDEDDGRVIEDYDDEKSEELIK